MNEQLLQSAWRQHQAGNLGEAQRLYLEVLRLNPKHFPALQMLAYLFFQRGEFSDAEKTMGRALKIEPKSVDALYNRGCALQALDRHKEALQCFDKAIDVKRDHAPAHLNRGTSLYRLGRHREALTSFDKALAIQPAYPEALLNRGNALLELKKPEDALSNYDKALAMEPGQPILWNNRGNALSALGRHDEALKSYERALAHDPRYADAYENRGDALAHINRDAEALADYGRAIALEPTNAGALHKIAQLLATLKRPEDALVAYDRLLSLSPGDGAAIVGRGVVLASVDRKAEALAAFDAALALDPKNAIALSNRAHARIAEKHFAEALADSDRALKFDSGNAATWHNRGSALSGLGRHGDAVPSFDRALTLAPANATMWNGRGAAALGLKHYDEALTNFDSALGLNPMDADALVNRATALSRLKRHPEAAESSERALFFQPEYVPAMRAHIHAKLNACDWNGLEEEKAAIAAALVAGRRAVQPFDNLAISESEEQNLIAARLYAEEEAPARAPLWHGQRYGHGKIRLGYISTDFREHAVGFLIVGALEHHDKSRFETVGFSIGPDDGGETRSRIVAASDRFIDLREKTDAQAAAMMREMEIDIAIDLNGYTGDARPGILSYRPAPVQVNYLGYPGTMGAQSIDYILADRMVIPESAAPHYAEKVVYLPDSYQANDSKRRVSDKRFTRGEFGLPENGFVFCSLSSAYKFARPTFDVWMRLLNAAEGSVLWLLEDNAAATANLRHEAQVRGVAPERLVFAPHALPAEHLARQTLADLFLDTLPYNAHTTASDALWMGLPILTCPGNTFPARVAASILHAAGLPELVTGSLADFEALALRLATNRDAHASIKTKVTAARGACALFDTARFTRHLEAAYLGMQERQLRGERPEGFSVARQ